MNGRERYFKNINLPFHCCSGGMAEWSGAALFFADEAVVQVQIQFFFPFGFLLFILTADPISFARFLRKRISSKCCNCIFLLS